VTEERPQLVPTSDAPQSRELTIPAFESNVYLGFNSTIGATDISTVAGGVLLWTPTKGHKFILRGIEIMVSCTVTCNSGAASASHLLLVDNATTQPVAVLGAYNSNATAANDVVVASLFFVNTRIYGAPLKLDFGKGFMSRAKDNKLYLVGTEAINGGRLRCTGCVWGVEVAG
jgi:hypothetical protein